MEPASEPISSGVLDTFFSDLERASLDIPGSAGRPVVRPKEQLAVPHFFVVPFYFWHEHFNTGKEPAILFSLQDFPLMKNLGIYREEAHAAGNQKLKD